MHELKAMTVAGATITSLTQAQAVAVFLRNGKNRRVQLRELDLALEKFGAPKGSGYRGSDRIIQKLRRGGFIVKTGRMWRTTAKGSEMIVALKAVTK